MHRALEIQEVLEMIVGHVNSNRALARLSRTCRSFFEPAASHLWKDMDATKFMRLSEIVLRWGPDDSTNVSYRWTRFQIYASLVRSFTIDLSEFNEEQTYESVFNEKLRQLVPFNRSLYLLPHLRMLDLFAGEPRDLRDAVFLLCPLLDDIAITCGLGFTPESTLSYDWVIAGTTFLEVLPDRAPNVQTLCLKFGGIFEIAHPDAILNLISNLQYLTSFKTSISVWERPLIYAIASSRILREVDIGVASDDLSVDFSCLGVDCFSALRTLNVRAPVRVAAGLLNAVSTYLEGLDFVGNTPGIYANADILSLTSVIGNRGRSLKELKFSIDEKGEKRSSAVHWESFARLSDCHDIRVFFFTFRSKTALDLRDSHIEAWAESKSSLTTFGLSWGEPTEQGRGGLLHEQALTLAALGALARCPHLRTVQITSLYAKIIPPPPFVTRRKEQVTLLLHNAPITMPDYVAAYLGTFWPIMKITVRLPLDQVDKDMKEQWAKVEQGLRMMRTVHFMEECKGLSAESFRDRFTSQYRMPVFWNRADPWPPLR